MKNTPFKQLTKTFFETSDFKVIDEIHEQRTNIPLWHLDMLTDTPRLEYYKSIISKRVEGKIVLDIGSGSGILSHLAIRAGAKKVYSVEHDPRLAAIYLQTMDKHLKSGKAVLLEMDAHEIKLADLGGVFPEVIIHEIFSADAFSEDVSSVFSSLDKKGFLKNATIIPNICEVLVEPVFSSQTDLIHDLKDFEDFPFSKLSHFGAFKRFQLNGQESAKDWKNVGEEKVLISYDLYHPEKTEIPEVLIECKEPCSHLRVSIRLIDESSNEILESNHARVESHWNNIFFSIPQWHRDSKAFKVNFRIWENQIALSRITPQ
jgi:SAM-dependent methyltransferase